MQRSENFVNLSAAPIPWRSSRRLNALTPALCLAPLTSQSRVRALQAYDCNSVIAFGLAGGLAHKAAV